jgi:hypothetical protein
MSIAYDRLRELLSYDPLTGEFVWRVTRSKVRAGSRAGTPTKDGYRDITISGRDYREHRLAWLYMTGELPSGQIDHKNRIRNDNRFDNLREATPSENAQNIKHKGATFHKQCGKWQAQIKVGSKPMYIGLFNTEQEAIEAYQKKKAELHPFFFKATDKEAA